MSTLPHRGRWLLPTLLFILGMGEQARAADSLSVPRADGASTPIVVYRPNPVPPPRAGNPCPPLAVISHGAGASETSYGYLGKAMADLGYIAVVMGHRESGKAALRASMRANGMRQGVAGLVADPSAESARLLDLDATLTWADAQCQSPFKVLLGHSMGSSTVMLEAGARNIIGVAAPPAGQDRFDAYVALSPEGPGIVFPEHAWHDIHKPVLILTGTRDQSLTGPPKTRQIPWADLPGIKTHCQWQGVIEGATHLNFAGVGLGADPVEALVARTLPVFLNGVRHELCAQPAAVTGLTLTIK